MSAERIWRSASGPLILLLLSLGLVAFVLWGRLSSQEARYRFRMTVEVDTPKGLRSGSSVYEVTARYRADLQPGGKKRDWTVRGEAVAVDLPDERTLFALMRTGADHGDLVELSMAALDPAFRNDVVESAGRLASGGDLRSPAEVVAEHYPFLVTFPDIADPRSVEEVSVSDLPARFGVGVGLRRIYVELTDQPVTTGILTRLPWLLDPDVIDTPGWSNLPDFARTVISALAQGTIERRR